jgi:hypothetical protein
MRMLTANDIENVSGGGVVISASRLRESYEVMNPNQFFMMYETTDGDGGGGGGEDPLGLIVDVGQEAWSWLNASQKLIDYREGNMKGIDMSKLEKKVVDGFTQWNDKEKGWYYLDIDKDGMPDSRYKDVNGVRFLDWNGGENFMRVPDRADWRAGYWLLPDGKYGDPYKFNPNNN